MGGDKNGGGGGCLYAGFEAVGVYKFFDAVGGAEGEPNEVDVGLDEGGGGLEEYVVLGFCCAGVFEDGIEIFEGGVAMGGAEAE